jgi:pimeloyl-ACP methyl ester carboxylesterase
VAGRDEEETTAARKGAQALREGADLTDALVESWYGPSFLRASGSRARATVRSWLKRWPEALAADIEASARAPDLRPALGPIATPALLRVGSDDRATPPEIARAIADALPNATFQQVEGAGHMLPEEDADATAEAIGAFHAG